MSYVIMYCRKIVPLFLFVSIFVNVVYCLNKRNPEELSFASFAMLTRCTIMTVSYSIIDHESFVILRHIDVVQCPKNFRSSDTEPNCLPCSFLRFLAETTDIG